MPVESTPEEAASLVARLLAQQEEMILLQRQTLERLSLVPTPQETTEIAEEAAESVVEDVLENQVEEVTAPAETPTPDNPGNPNERPLNALERLLLAK